MYQLHKLSAGQEAIKNDIKGELNTIWDKMENSINTMETKTSPNQKKMKNDIQEQVRNDISAIRYSHVEFEEKIMDKLDKHLKGIVTVAEQQTQKLCKVFSCESQVTQQDIELA
jgi:hypothetical protein